MIHDSTVVADSISGALEAYTAETFSVERVSTRAQGMSRLQFVAPQNLTAAGEIAAILAQWQPVDALNDDSLDALIGAAAHVPVLVLCSPHDEQARRLMARRGAQDYYAHSVLDPLHLPRAVSMLLARTRVADELFNERERAQLTLDSIADAVMSIDVGYGVTFLNKAAERITGWPHGDALGLLFNDVFQVVNADTGDPVINPLGDALKKDATCSLPPNCNLVRRDRSEVGIEDSAAPIHSRSGAVTGAVIVFRDVSEVRAASKRLSFLAQHDALTGLPNRTVLHDLLKRSIDMALQSGGSFAVMFLDIDRFKLINDALGHTAGDAVLRTLARRLVTGVRAADTVSRHGGDEFVILLPSIQESANAAHCAQKLLAVARLPMMHDGAEINVTASAGIALFPQDGTDSETLLQSADAAMYEAKQRGRNTYQFYRTELESGASERWILEKELRRAIERDELVLHYQPKVDLVTRRLTGVEALIRWRHPRRGLIRPLEFIAHAEATGLIIPIGRWVLREASRQALCWNTDQPVPVPMAVNVSALELRAQDYLGSVKKIMTETGIDPKLLEFEITETFLLQDSSTTSRVLSELKDLGIRLTLDDFGTGYSSLSFMRRYPIDVLKVDQSFVRDVTTNSQDANVVSAIIHMAQSMHMGVVAEGVETEAQRSFLLDHGCTEGQGYYFGRPQSASALTHRHGHIAPVIDLGQWHVAL